MILGCSIPTVDPCCRLARKAKKVTSDRSFLAGKEIMVAVNDLALRASLGSESARSCGLRAAGFRSPSNLHWSIPNIRSMVDPAEMTTQFVVGALMARPRG